MRRAAVLALVSALVVGGCSSGDDKPVAAAPASLPAAPSGTAWQTVLGFSFLHPDGWVREAQTARDERSVVYTAPVTDAGVTPQVALAAGPDYPDSLADAVRLSKLDRKTRYPGYTLVSERTMRIAGADAYRIEGTYLAFTEERPRIRMVDILVQTPARIQGSFFVRAADVDFRRLDLERLADSLRRR